MRSTTATSAFLLLVVFTLFNSSCKKDGTCNVATVMTTSNYTNTSVVLNWAAATDASSYNLLYRLTGTTSWTTVSNVVSPYTLTGLAANTSYEWEIETKCSAGSTDSPKAGFKTNSGSVPRLIFQFYFDSTQVRLDNFGNPSTIPSGHAGISPRFNKMSAHYVELAQNTYTQLGAGAVLYRAPETSIGGTSAIDFDSSTFAGQNGEFFSMPLSTVAAGSYDWLRVSLAYQNFDVDMVVNIPPYANNMNLTGTLASFVGYNTYIHQYKVKDSTVVINANKAQGYWGFETMYSLNTGQAQATTVPNPLANTSPIPAGSCVVTGQFASPLVITGTEDHDVVIKVSISTNKSFEFQDSNGNGKWDVNASGPEPVVDMGVRGLVPIKLP